MQNVRDEDIDKILSEGPGNPRRAEAMQVLMDAYTPEWRKQATGRRAQPIEGLAPEAAEGLVQAADAGFLSEADWMELVQLWDRVVATAELPAETP